MLFEHWMLNGMWIKYEYNSPQNGRRNEIWAIAFKLWCSTITIWKLANQGQLDICSIGYSKQSSSLKFLR